MSVTVAGRTDGLAAGRRRHRLSRSSRRRQRATARRLPAPVRPRPGSVILGVRSSRSHVDRPRSRSTVPQRVGAVHPRRRPDHALHVGRSSISSRSCSRSSGRSAGCRRTASINGVASLYVSLVRGTPLIVQIFFIYLALPAVRDRRPGRSPTGIIALAFNYGAYMTEIFRAGIQAVPRGQVEAAAALGMPSARSCGGSSCRRRSGSSSRPIGNDFIAMIKDSALVSRRRRPGALLAGPAPPAARRSAASRRCSSRRSSTGC